jgi:hypothetical protein
MLQFIEQLEPRQFLSVSVPFAGVEAMAAPPAAMVVAAKKVKIVPSVMGTWTGINYSVEDDETVRITLRVTAQQGKKFQGIVTSPDDAWMSVVVNGVVTPKGAVKLKLTGRDSWGPLKGSTRGSLHDGEMYGIGRVRYPGERITIGFMVRMT